MWIGGVARTAVLGIFCIFAAKFGFMAQRKDVGNQPESDQVDLGCGLRALCPVGNPAAALGPRDVRAAALVRGAGEPPSNLATEIYSEDGKVIGTFFVQNRSYVQYADLFPADSTLHIRLDGHEVPPIVAALISTEDVRFRSHSGIDIPSLARVAVEDRAAAEHLPGRRFDHHAAVGQEPLPARYGPQPRADRARQSS